MKAKQRLDKIISSCREKMQDESSALLGTAITFGDPEIKILTKQEFFEEPAGQSVLAHIKLEGDLKGDGCIIIPLKDAIRIGGTLIMLPESELQSVMADDNYTDELEDSYGEIANILCGSITSTFEEQHPKTIRLVRTEQEVIQPVKVDVDSDQPIPVGSYYTCIFPLSMDDAKMGVLQLLLPAGPLGLVEENAETSTDNTQVASDGQSTSSDSVADSSEQVGETGAARENVETEDVATLEKNQNDDVDSGATGSPVKRGKDLEKQQKIINTLLGNCLDKLSEEVGALIGGSLKCSNIKEVSYTKEDFLEQAGGKQILARMDVRGATGKEAYLFVDMSVGIYLGGCLIMLPESELEETVRNEEFGEDATDAYGEIANIIAGVYTSVFEEQYREKFGFVKTELETVIPIKVDPDSDETIPNHLYYTSSCDVAYNEKEIGRFQAVFPASLFQLEGLAPEEEVDSRQDISSGNKSDTVEKGDGSEFTSELGGSSGPAATSGERLTGGTSATNISADVLVFSDDDQEGSSIGEVLQQLGFEPKVLQFKNQVNDYLTSSIRLVFIVMKNISEQGFAVAIKVNSTGVRVPVVAAGPAWTRTMVIKAVKYGADDILITPASADDIREKVDMNLSKIAA